MSKPPNRNTAKLPKNARLRAIATAAALDVPQLMSEKEPEILAAWKEC